MVILRSFIIGIRRRHCSAGSSIAPRVLEMALTAVGVEHVHSSHLLLLQSNYLANCLQQILEIITILFLDLQHTNEHASYLFSELALDSLQFLKERVEFYLEILEVIDVIQLLPEYYFNQHDS